MVEKIIRKQQMIGGYTSFITLPRDWVKTLPNGAETTLQLEVLTDKSMLLKPLEKRLKK